jgi:chloramphenicol 3-O phosphotransferase
MGSLAARNHLTDPFSKNLLMLVYNLEKFSSQRKEFKGYPMKSGTIIILNCAFSSGKSSLLKELQNTLHEPYLNTGLDKFLWILPSRYLDRPLWDDVLGKADHAGETGHKLIYAMHRAMLALAENGFNLLTDHVLVEPAWVEDCANLFAGHRAYLIGIRCPLEVLEQREKDRRDRTLGQARLQFERVHAHEMYDLEVDTSVESVAITAKRIRDFMESGVEPTAFNKLKVKEEN